MQEVSREAATFYKIHKHHDGLSVSGPFNRDSPPITMKLACKCGVVIEEALHAVQDHNHLHWLATLAGMRSDAAAEMLSHDDHLAELSRQVAASRRVQDLLVAQFRSQIGF
jgi:hypothetical protein